MRKNVRVFIQDDFSIGLTCHQKIVIHQNAQTISVNIGSRDDLFQIIQDGIRDDPSGSETVTIYKFSLELTLKIDAIVSSEVVQSFPR